MPGRTSSSNVLQYVGVIAAIVGVIGYVVFGWQFGETDSPIAFALGAIRVSIAGGWELYRRVAREILRCLC
jgi:CHASE2 domain-containing sensor protein